MPKLNLRDLFWLVLVAAIGCGWWLEHEKRSSELDEVIELRKQAEIRHHWAGVWMLPPGAVVRDGFQVDAFDHRGSRARFKNWDATRSRQTTAMVATVVPDLWSFDRLYDEVIRYG